MVDRINQGNGRSSLDLTLKPRCIVKVQKSKVDRIEQLKELGFNTPLMYFVPKNITGYDLDCDIDAALIWASKEVYSKNRLINLRTYDFQENSSSKKESFATDHVTDIGERRLREVLKKYVSQFNLMLDAEIPDNGRIAGTVHVSSNDFGRPTEVTCFYCEEQIRAMVRNADTIFVKPVHEVLNISNDEPDSGLKSVIAKVVSKIISKRLFNVQLEFTYFSEPSGVNNENIVYWEYKPLDMESETL